MTNYEVMFIIDPTLEEAKKEATIEKVKDIIAADGEVSKVDCCSGAPPLFLLRLSKNRRKGCKI